VPLEVGMIVLQRARILTRTGGYGISRIENMVTVVEAPVEGAERHMLGVRDPEPWPPIGTAIGRFACWLGRNDWLDAYPCRGGRLPSAPMVDRETAKWLATAHPAACPP